MYQLVIRLKAIHMAKEAYEWYEEQQLGLGNLFLLELDRSYDKLETWPTSYAKIKNNFRQINLRTFPYVVVYEIINSDIIVYAVFHTSRSPRKKFKK